jgi:acyl-CoA synthetase (NDP forming)
LSPAEDVLDRLLARALSEGREVLLEPEGLELIAALGIQVPVHEVVGAAEEVTRIDLGRFPGEQVVIKVVSPDILHKSDVGGVLVVPRDLDTMFATVRSLEKSFAGQDIRGYLIVEFIPHQRNLGHELLLGAHWTEDFGPVVTLGPGGIYTEFLASSLKVGRDVAIMSPGLTAAEDMESILAEKALTPLITGRLRGQKAIMEMAGLTDLASRLMEFAALVMPEKISEFEINPLVLAGRGAVALDALVRLGHPAAAAAPPRPLHKLHHLLQPEQIGIMGVSSGMNPGRIILKNLLRQGFTPDCLHVIKPGCETLDGCRCYPGLDALPVTLDLLVLSISAAQVPAVVEEVVSSGRAESLIVIPGGLGEVAGSEGLARQVRKHLDRSRTSPGEGPLVNGGNCLGIRSRPGGFDTMFIPDYKLPPPVGRETPLAVISQSGAWAVARASKLADLVPRYMISIGNQVDLTLGDYMEALQHDPEVRIFACYVEGFQPGDGARWMKAAADITASGRTVILYRAGRTPSGARATASHTASIAGEYAVTRELARQAGVVVADTLADYEDLVQLFSYLHKIPVAGRCLGAISNAGFECVAVADNLGSFTLAEFAPHTTQRLRELFAQCRLESVVDVHNPLDVTPLMSDAVYAEAVCTVMEDEQVDVGIIGVVPLSGAIQTLAPGEQHQEDVNSPGSLAGRLLDWHGRHHKPWVAVVDGGAPFDAMVRRLEKGGVPTFRTADRAMRLLESSDRTFRVERLPLCYMADHAWASTETRKIVKAEERTTHFLDRRGALRQGPEAFVHSHHEPCAKCSLRRICAGLHTVVEANDPRELAPQFIDPEPIRRSIITP